MSAPEESVTRNGPSTSTRTTSLYAAGPAPDTKGWSPRVQPRARLSPMTFEMIPIGVVRNDRTEAIDDDWDRVNSTIELDLSVVGDEAIKGLFRFSHIEVVFVFDRVDPNDVELGARHPRGNAEWPKVGILAQRAKAVQPNEQ